MVSLRRENRKSNLRTAATCLLHPLVSVKDEDSLPDWFFIAVNIY